MKDINRRQFLKGGALAGLAGALAKLGFNLDDIVAEQEPDELLIGVFDGEPLYSRQLIDGELWDMGGGATAAVSMTVEEYNRYWDGKSYIDAESPDGTRFRFPTRD